MTDQYALNHEAFVSLAPSGALSSLSMQWSNSPWSDRLIVLQVFHQLDNRPTLSDPDFTWVGSVSAIDGSGADVVIDAFIRVKQTFGNFITTNTITITPGGAAERMGWSMNGYAYAGDGLVGNTMTVDTGTAAFPAASQNDLYVPISGNRPLEVINTAFARDLVHNNSSEGFDAALCYHENFTNSSEPGNFGIPWGDAFNTGGRVVGGLWLQCDAYGTTRVDRHGNFVYSVPVDTPFHWSIALQLASVPIAEDQNYAWVKVSFGATTGEASPSDMGRIGEAVEVVHDGSEWVLDDVLGRVSVIDGGGP